MVEQSGTLHFRDEKLNPAYTKASEAIWNSLDPQIQEALLNEDHPFNNLVSPFVYAIEELLGSDEVDNFLNSKRNPSE